MSVAQNRLCLSSIICKQKNTLRVQIFSDQEESIVWRCKPAGVFLQNGERRMKKNWMTLKFGDKGLQTEWINFQVSGTFFTKLGRKTNESLNIKLFRFLRK